jgi:hypothetical protein
MAFVPVTSGRRPLETVASSTRQSGLPITHVTNRQTSLIIGSFTGILPASTSRNILCGPNTQGIHVTLSPAHA